MRRLSSFSGVLAIVLFSVSLAGTASAGYWQVVYDLAPGSTLLTVDPLGNTEVDAITGTLTVDYDAATQSAPLSGARLVQGNVVLSVYQAGAYFVMTGSSDTSLEPPTGGTPGTITGTTNLNFDVVADSSTTAFLHCNENLTQTGQTGNCALANMTHTVPVPQTPTGPGPFPQVFPKFVFATTAGVGDFTSTVLTQTVQTGTPPLVFTFTRYTTYVGREISRVWHSGAPPVPSISGGGLAVLGFWVGAVGVVGSLRLRRRRRAEKSG